MQGIALITGASAGIGAEIAKLYSHNNYHVILTARRQELLEKVASLCPGPQTIIPADLSNNQQLHNLCNQVLMSTPWKNTPRKVLINNAGAYLRERFSKSQMENWHKMFQVNFFSAVQLTRELWDSLQNGGSVVNIASTLGLRPLPGTSAYSASKAAMVNWSHCLALEGAKMGIRVNTICPGIVETPIHDWYHLPAVEREKMINDLNKMQPIGRIGTPQEIAQSAFFLGSENSSWTTGAVLNVDGGINL